MVDVIQVILHGDIRPALLAAKKTARNQPARFLLGAKSLQQNIILGRQQEPTRGRANPEPNGLLVFPHRPHCFKRLDVVGQQKRHRTVVVAIMRQELLARNRTTGPVETRSPASEKVIGNDSTDC